MVGRMSGPVMKSWHPKDQDQEPAAAAALLEPIMYNYIILYVFSLTLSDHIGHMCTNSSLPYMCICRGIT